MTPLPVGDTTVLFGDSVTVIVYTPGTLDELALTGATTALLVDEAVALMVMLVVHREELEPEIGATSVLLELEPVSENAVPLLVAATEMRRELLALELETGATNVLLEP